ncbi:MAG: NAD(P)/FAD-dependent oxidoreductase [Rubrobacter sp.]
MSLESERTERYDLIVVGAGPGGAATAYYGARAGLKTLALDRQTFPRDKPCGDGLMPHATEEVTLMGLGDWLEEPHHGRFTGFSLYTDTASFRHTVPATLHGPRGYTVRRQETDEKLVGQAKSAGVEVLEGIRATKLLRSPAGSVTGVEAQNGPGDLRFSAPLVVAADGIGNFARDRIKARQNAVARRQYFKNVNGPNQQDLQIFITKDMNEGHAGYGWVFYFGDGTANVGAGVSTKALAKSGRSLTDFYDRFLEEPIMQEWLDGAEAEGPAKSWSLKMGMLGAKRYTQGMMTVGDSASMVHPISGEGVGYAIESGRLAASWAYEAHARNDFSAATLSGYGKQLRKKRAREHVSGQAVVDILPNLNLLEPVFKACEGDAALRATLIATFTGDAPIYDILKHPKALTGVAKKALEELNWSLGR